MKVLLFDLETTLIPRDGWIPDKVHCGSVLEVSAEGAEIETYRPNQLDALVARLGEADVLVGHNIAQFDIPVLEERLGFVLRDDVELYDTLQSSRVIYIATIAERGWALRRLAGKNAGGSRLNREKAEEAALPSHLVMRHSLESWGYRLKFPKGSFAKSPENFDAFSEDMLEYNVNDVGVNAALYVHLLGARTVADCPPTPVEAIWTESRCAYILGKQERNGCGIDVAGAASLAAEFSGKRDELTRALREMIPAWFVPGKVKTPKRTAQSRAKEPGETGYRNVREGCEMQDATLTEFNPASKVHVADRLMTLYGWVPDVEHLTEVVARVGGKLQNVPRVDEKTLKNLEYPPCPLLAEYLLVNKRLGQISEGKQAWLKLERGGVVHGRVMTTGARTTRMSHKGPNQAQVPRVGSPYGEECRALFRPTRPGFVMVGADASGIQLRMLAHRMAIHDGGEFGAFITRDDYDVHDHWRELAGLFFREHQKTFNYAMLFGAGDVLLGGVVLKDWRHAYADGLTLDKPPTARYAMELGKAAKAKLIRGLPAFGKVLETCATAHKRGFVRCIDGRIVKTASEHSVIADLLQSDEACVMKRALVIFSRRMREFVDRGHAAYMLNVHDEWQLECLPEIAEVVGQYAVEAIREAGVALGVRVPLDGEYKIGSNWKDTH